MALNRKKAAWLLLLSMTALCHAPAAHAAVSLFAPAPGASGFEQWWRGITFAGHIDGGITANPARPANGINFGNFIGDHANQAQLNQVDFSLIRPLDPDARGYSFGFTLEANYGSDSRYYHLLGISDRAFNARYQIIPAQAHVDAHLPWFTKLGVEMHAGILQAPMGPEAFDPGARPFYTFSYTGEYSVPFEHVGMMATIHITPMIDVLTGIDTGNQTTFGRSDNNAEPAGYAGINLNNLAHGKLTITELSRFGPEDSRYILGSQQANGAMRFWNDLVAACHVTDKLTLTGEFNYLHDNGLRADAESVVTYLSWNFARNLTFNYRGEIYRDNTGQLVTSFLSDEAYMRGVAGTPAPAESAPPTTYGAMTLGITWRKPLTEKVGYFAIRPEIRFDRSLNGTTPFNDGRNTGMFTFGGDMMIGF
ncbi:outer membrane beta-barrel protein [Acetobacter fallax]|uniref:Outer membrane beta-barrel protein n=1 Tax=Acetobacter fallax TaxID=1737473 RepID=A0ABX0KFR7_9PROT|nr:outer membrane beta-barrel protein [Acetobacter fallax]NHO33823.1 outer membrane beta-barrel protein [Acetobacter fallax]NHO37398.1 outer membrane beta-barrel protein [Acetobacter fallax]